jgi:cytochrome c oxidase assembly protein Cox11
MDDVTTITLSYTFFRQDMTEEELSKFRLSQVGHDAKTNDVN